MTAAEGPRCKENVFPSSSVADPLL